MRTWQLVAGAVAPSLVFIGGVIGTYYSRRTGEEANRTADWSAFVREQREWTEDRLEERDRHIKDLKNRLDNVQEQLVVRI